MGPILLAFVVGAASPTFEDSGARLTRDWRGEALIVELSGGGSDEVLSRLEALPRLECLKIERRSISDAGLARIGALLRLKRLYFRDVDIADDGLRHLATSTRLEVLALQKTKVAGPGLAHLAGLRELRVLNLGECGIADAALAHLAPLRGIETLALHRTTATDAGIAHLARLPRLCVLNLEGCAVTDACLAHLGGLDNLRILRMRGCKVTKERLEEFKRGMSGLAIFQSVLSPSPPRKTIRTPDCVYVGTPYDVIDKMLDLAAVSPKELAVDLGCGDSRILVAAAKRFGCRGIGYDIDPRRILESEERIRKEGVGDLVRAEERDIFLVDLGKTDVVFLYLLPKMNERLIPQLEKLRPGSRIVCHDYGIGGIVPETWATIDSLEDGAAHTVYLYRTPLRREEG